MNNLLCAIGNQRPVIINFDQGTWRSRVRQIWSHTGSTLDSALGSRWAQSGINLGSLWAQTRLNQREPISEPS